MTDDTDNNQNILTRTCKPNRITACPRCGLFMNGFVECPWCSKIKRAEKKPKINNGLWVGKERIR